MPKHSKVQVEKPKNFKEAIVRLTKELNSFKVFIIIALLLSSFSALLSIVSPNKLKDLTNEITSGITPNVNNIRVLSTEIMNNIDKSDITIAGVKIKYSEQVEFLTLFSKYDKNSDSKKIYNALNKLPKSIKKVIEPKMNIDKIKRISLLILILYVLSSLLNYIQSIIMSNVSSTFSKILRSKISNKINNLPLKYFDSHKNGDIMSRVTNDVDQISHSLNQSLTTLVSSVTLLLGSLIMMFVTNGIMALTAIFSSIIGFIFMALVLSKSQKYFAVKQKELGNLNGNIEEVYSGLNIIKTYNAKEEVSDKFDKYNKRVYDANKKSQFLAGLMQPMMGFVGNLGYVCVCIVGALLVSKNVITFGVIVAFISYVRLFTSPLSQIAQSVNMLQQVAASSERVFEFLDEEELRKESKLKKISKNKFKGNIEFKNVSFKYDGNDKYTIKNFSASIKAGQKVAIVGPTGAGKTTMVNLLMKFYDITDGDITIDGISIKDLRREDVHSLFTMVLQDTWLFNGSIKDNIAYNKNVSLDKVVEVCKIVGLDHFIRTLPNGYDSLISDNDSVSAGQRQLMTIARGMILDSPFLILDEATSNVDTRTEELVQKAMDKLSSNKTSFIIAHRLSTIKNADLILVMKDGNIIEQGTHKELINKKGFYADLYNSQFDL